MAESRYSEAMSILEELGDYKDAAALYEECNYEYGIDLIEKGSWAEAIDCFNKATNHEDSSKYISYASACIAATSGDHKTAMESFAELHGFLDSDDKYDENVISYVKSAKNLEISAAIKLYESINHPDQSIQNEIASLKDFSSCAGRYIPSNTRIVKETGEESIVDWRDGQYITLEAFLDQGVKKVKITQLLGTSNINVPAVPVENGSEGYKYSITFKSAYDNDGTLYFSSNEMKADLDKFAVYIYLTK